MYVGSTNDLKMRLEDHNKGKVVSTKRYKPWKLIYYEAFLEEKFARMRESKLKHHGNSFRQLKARIGMSGAGFTLLELLIVITIIGLLAGVLVVLVNPVTQLAKTRDLERKNTLKTLQGALEQYYSDNGAYPTTAGAWLSSEGTDWIPGLAPKYTRQLPEDPAGGVSELVGCTDVTRAYMYRSDGQEYAIVSYCAVETSIDANDPFYFDSGTSMRVFEGPNASSWTVLAP